MARADSAESVDSISGAGRSLAPVDLKNEPRATRRAWRRGWGGPAGKNEAFQPRWIPVHTIAGSNLGPPKNILGKNLSTTPALTQAWPLIFSFLLPGLSDSGLMVFPHERAGGETSESPPVV
jgi:hypothetical protein